MKHLSLLIIAIFLFACSGSETYRGEWKATDRGGVKLEIVFAEKSFTIKDSVGETVKFEYVQNSVSTKNGVKNYGIQLSDGRGYQINFPKADDASIGLMLDGNGDPVYTISRKDYINYEEVFKLK